MGEKSREAGDIALINRTMTRGTQGRHIIERNRIMNKLLRTLFPSFREVLAGAFCLCLILVGAAFSLSSSSVLASGDIPLSGAGWGASYLSATSTGSLAGGIGWLSFNCLDTHSCATSNYSVSAGSDNYITGAAWSDNYGWVEFGGLSGFPSGPGTVSDNAKITDATNFTGWARLCSMDPSCNPNAPSGSDGWISLSGIAGNGSAYGVKILGTTLSGAAWGGPDIGWIDFSGASIGAVQGASIGLQVAPEGSTNFAKSVTVPAGSTVTVSWSASSIPPGTDCTADSSVPNDDWVANQPYASDGGPFSYQIPTNSPKSIALGISCPDADGNLVESSATINVEDSNAPTVSLQVFDPSPTVNKYVDTSASGPVELTAGTPVQLKWTSANATQCIGNNFSASGTSGSVNAGPAVASSMYILDCSNDTGGERTGVAEILVNNSLGACADPAGGTPLDNGEIRTYAKTRQGKTCPQISRICKNGVLGNDPSNPVSNDPSSPDFYGKYIYPADSCTFDPNYHEI